jgi:hypothetical protein
MNPRHRIAKLAEQLGPRPADDRTSHSTAEQAAVLLKFARPGSAEARRLKRIAKGATPPDVLTADEQARLQKLFDAARTSAATQQRTAASLPPQQAQLPATDALPPATETPTSAAPVPVRLMPQVGWRRPHG